MESAAVLRSVHGVGWTTQRVQNFLEKPVAAALPNAAFKLALSSRVTFVGQGLVSPMQNGKRSFLPYIKASEAPSAVVSDSDTSGKTSQESVEKNTRRSTFPNGFEAMILGVCDETSVAELKVKIGDFEMHLKRDMGVSTPTPAVPHISSPTTAPPIPSEPMADSDPAAPPVVVKKSPPASSSPFASISSATASKLAALDASGSNNYVILSSPTVGSFRSGRTLKGKKQPPSCKVGDIIKEGQTIGYLDQFGNELPIRSDVAGEVLKVLFQDGEPVGYGDPLVAVLPSFHDIK